MSTQPSANCEIGRASTRLSVHRTAGFLRGQRRSPGAWTLAGASRSFGVLARCQLPILAVGLWHYHDDSTFGLLALFLVDRVRLAAAAAALRLALHLSTGRWLVFWRGLGGATRDATVGLWVEQVLNFGVLLVLGEDGEAWRGFERQAGSGIGLPGKTEKAERADCGSRSH